MGKQLICFWRVIKFLYNIKRNGLTPNPPLRTLLVQIYQCAVSGWQKLGGCMGLGPQFLNF